MDNESNKITQSTSSTQCVIIRKQILNYLNQEVNKHTLQIANAQREIAAVKMILGDAKQRLERINNRENQPK